MEMQKLLQSCLLWKKMMANWDDDAVENKTVVADDHKEKCDLLNVYVPRKQRSQVTAVGSNHNKQQEMNVFQNPIMINHQEISRKSKKHHREVESNQRPKKDTKKRRGGGPRPLAPQVHLLPNPPLPQNLKDYIDNLKLVRPPLFVANKVLRKTDLNPGQSRLSFPISRVSGEFINNFLSAREKADLERREDIEVSFVDERLQEYNDLYLKIWSLTDSTLYVFKRGWNTMVSKNPFRADQDIVQVWAFRVEERLWFALFTTPA